MESVLLMAVVYLAAATICVPAAVRLGLGSVLGYLVAGVMIGPLTGLVGSETADLQHFAEFGVVMMLFLIGLELDPATLWRWRARLLGLGGGQVVLTALLVGGAALAMGQTLAVAAAAGAAFSLSSTAIVMQTLQEKRLNQTPGGRHAFSVLLSQDIAVIPLLALLPLFAPGYHAPEEHGGHDAAVPVGDGASAQMAEQVTSFIDTLPPWGVALATIAAVAFVILGGRFLTRPVFAWVGRAQIREMLTVVSLLFVIGVAALMMLVGLSPALGTFLAGVVLANSEYRHELEADIEPFKGLLLGLFFITVGAGIDFGVLMGAPFLVAGLVLGLIALKGAVLFGLGSLFGLRGRDRILFTLSLAQAGEFGFVLVSLALAQGLLTPALSALFLLIVALSMLLTPILFILYDWYAARAPGLPEIEPDEIDEEGEVIIAGVGRFGQVVHRMLQAAGLRTVVLDHDIETIQLLRTFGLKTYVGDPTRPELLKAAGLSKATLLVIALDDRADAVRLVKTARSINPDIQIIARAYDRTHAYELYRAGADDIVREMFDSALRAGRYVLERMGWSDAEALRARDAYFRHDRTMLLDLARLWKPGVPLSQNAEYVERAKAYNKDFENALMQRFGEDEEAAEEARAAGEAADRAREEAAAEPRPEPPSRRAAG
ncbi:monovalent cation:proton antiporter-2 (CPA2) family protein [Jannaschia sp. W003]|uniref:monovalent cation:proton antiporter-2 (CPA2) family protein n=1 Tax=Jannaschia sp. W003 TaxID=2867012 RepID=UPI0021A58E09|nr:monovalent cation:proton antiporter-2 (CPA2) family protein [Jannaschia sp. W003]UWQ20033.1 monovalent cation:proton antiporter-2 (CPA2) family protein [Jannaschia sp. W003]